MYFKIKGVQQYLIKPKATPVFYQYSGLGGNYKFTNCASAFDVAATWFILSLNFLWVMYNKQTLRNDL